MTSNSPYNFVPLQPIGRNETNTSNTYTPDDMIKIYEQQFLIEVPEDKITEFLPALKEFYGIDGHTLDISAVIFDAIADFCIIYNHKVRVGGYEIRGSLVKEEIEQEGNEQEFQAYSLDCKRTFFINDVELSYRFNLFIHGDSYSVLPEKDTLLEKLYWFVSDKFDETEVDTARESASLQAINEQLTELGIRSMDTTTINEIVEYIDDSIINDEMVDALNTLLDDAE